MRHLYAAEPPAPHLVEQARTYERRRCNHHVLDQPLSTLECLRSVVDAKASRTNKHRYVVASQRVDVRASLRTIAGVPQVYINRSVMIMEPMTDVTVQLRAREEKGKFRAGLLGKRSGSSTLKRKREDADAVVNAATVRSGPVAETVRVRKKGPKGPNPLSVKKPKRDVSAADRARSSATSSERPSDDTASTDVAGVHGQEASSIKKKRRRKHKTASLEMDAPSLKVGTILADP